MQRAGNFIGDFMEKPEVTSEGFLGALQEGDAIPTGWKDTPRWALDKWAQSDQAPHKPRQEFGLTAPSPMFAGPPRPPIGWDDWQNRLRGGGGGGGY